MLISSQKGISLILSLFILTAILFIGLVIIDLVLRQGKISSEVGYSEIAFYAAEAGMEKALYEINKNKETIINVEAMKETLSVSRGEWEVEDPIKEILKAPDYEPKLYTSTGGDISNTNPLQVDLNDQESFQLGLDLNLDTYPTELDIAWSANSSLIVFEWKRGEPMETGIQTIYSSLSSPITIESYKYYIFRIINLSGSNHTYTFTPGFGTTLPLGVFITTLGRYKGLSRKIETNNSRWQIY